MTTKFAHVIDGVVANISEGPNDWTAPAGVVVVFGDVRIGDTYADGQFARPVQRLDAVQRQAALVAAVQAHLDATARGLGYDSIHAAATYADEPAVPRFQAEGRALRAWRSQVWDACHAILAGVVNGVITDEPAELVRQLPPFAAPKG